MNTYDIELPAEFRSGNDVPVTIATIKRERMEEILRAAVEADRKRQGDAAKVLAELVALIPLADTLKASASCQDLIDYFKGIVADRKRRGEPVKVPSEEEIEALAFEYCDETGAGGDCPRFIGTQSITRLIRALLPRYSGQPIVCNECGGSGAGGLYEDDCSQNSSSQPVAWMAADGRVASVATKRNSMPQPSREAFCIPLGIINTVEHRLDTPAASAETCKTCGGSGWIGGPTYYQPDEGGESCPDCAAPVAQEPVATLKGVDEYGPMLDWHRHWAEFPIGTNFFTAPVAAQAQPDEDQCDDLDGDEEYRDVHDEIMVRLDRIAVQEQQHASDADLLGCAGVHCTEGLPTITGTADIRRFAHCVLKHWGSAQDREDHEVCLADTQRAIIEAAERRGYERAIAECAQVARAAKGQS